MTEEERKAAKAAAQKRWYEKNKATHVANVRMNTERYRQAAREHVWGLKENSPCTDCGLHYPHYVMQYDHLDNKVLDVSRMVQDGYSIATIDKEIAKCELVCANCHCVRTWNRRLEARG